MTKPKLCKDCKWIRKHFLPKVDDKCAHIKLLRKNTLKGKYLVTGETNIDFEDFSWCEVNRIYGSCGTKGRYWEEKDGHS